MSKIGKQPVVILEGVDISIKEEALEVKNGDVVLRVPILPGISVSEDNGFLVFSAKNSNKQTLSNWGTMRSIAENAIIGVKEGFVKNLILEGVGYRASVEGDELVLNLGYSHPVRYKIPDGIQISVDKSTVKISGHDKELVGKASAEIRGFRKPEPYKGKGIRYSDEIIRRKAGKKAVGSGG